MFEYISNVSILGAHDGKGPQRVLVGSSLASTSLGYAHAPVGVQTKCVTYKYDNIIYIHFILEIVFRAPKIHC
jgi:hypothetical protein